jgi:hypothetical protein
MTASKRPEVASLSGLTLPASSAQPPDLPDRVGWLQSAALLESVRHDDLLDQKP